MKYNLLLLNPGDLLLRPKCLGIVQHEGVVIGPNAVLHNTPDKGEHVTTVEDFADGKPVRVYPTSAAPATIRARAQQLLYRPRPYDPLTRNCQHTASELIQGCSSSTWIQAIALLLVIAIAAWATGNLCKQA
ncbi:MAG: hypothetical protein ACREP9_16730 [Candidatus Dormibacteraceae bacterium]